MFDNRAQRAKGGLGACPHGEGGEGEGDGDGDGGVWWSVGVSCGLWDWVGWDSTRGEYVM